VLGDPRKQSAKEGRGTRVLREKKREKPERAHEPWGTYIREAGSREQTEAPDTLIAGNKRGLIGRQRQEREKKSISEDLCAREVDRTDHRPSGKQGLGTPQAQGNQEIQCGTMLGENEEAA